MTDGELLVGAAGVIGSVTTGVVMWMRTRRENNKADHDDTIARYKVFIDQQSARHMDSIQRRDEEQSKYVAITQERIGRLESNAATQQALINRLQDENANYRADIDVLYVIMQNMHKCNTAMGKRLNIDAADLPEMPPRPNTSSSEFQSRTTAQNTGMLLTKPQNPGSGDACGS